MCLDTVLKPATGFEVSTKGPDTQLSKKTCLNQLHDIYFSYIYSDIAQAAPQGGHR